MAYLIFATVAVLFVWLAARESGREVGTWPGGYWSFQGWCRSMGGDGAEVRELDRDVHNVHR